MNIEFDPQDREQVETVKQMLNHGKYVSALDEIYNLARNHIKHGDTRKPKALVETLEEIKKIASQHLFEGE